MSSQKVISVSALSSGERYEYFVRKIADFETVWGLRSTDGWATAVDLPSQATVFPVWPEAEFAAQSATGDWAGMLASAIPLNEFMDKWLPGLEMDRRLVSAFPVPGGKAPLVRPGKLLEDIRRESEQYE